TVGKSAQATFDEWTSTEYSFQFPPGSELWETARSTSAFGASAFETAATIQRPAYGSYRTCGSKTVPTDGIAPKKAVGSTLERAVPSEFCWIRAAPLTVTTNFSRPGAPSVSGGMKRLLSSTALKLVARLVDGDADGSARNVRARGAAPRPAARSR